MNTAEKIISDHETKQLKQIIQECENQPGVAVTATRDQQIFKFADGSQLVIFLSTGRLEQYKNTNN